MLGPQQQQPSLNKNLQSLDAVFLSEQTLLQIDNLELPAEPITTTRIPKALDRWTHWSPSRSQQEKQPQHVIAILLLART